jgi:hypothetical protein
MALLNNDENITYRISEWIGYASGSLFTRTEPYRAILGKMPPPNSTNSIQQEGRIVLAMDALKQGYFTSMKGAAKSYDVPYTTLRRRICECPARRDARPTNCKLTTIEESTLVQWILSMDQRGLSPRPDFVQQMANLLLEK